MSDTRYTLPIQNLKCLSFICSVVRHGHGLRKIPSLRPKKKICVFTVTCQKNIGSVGRDKLFSLSYYRQNRKKSFSIPESDISFSKFTVNRHLLNLFYDKLCSFSTFFALNFDKKLAVE